MSSDTCIANIHYTYRVQQDATNFDFRKRHYEMKRAKEELEYQMKTVRSSSTQDRSKGGYRPPL